MATAKKKKVKRNVPKAVAHVQASFNNTIISVTDPNGDVICWGSAGTIGFKGLDHTSRITDEHFPL